MALAISTLRGWLNTAWIWRLVAGCSRITWNSNQWITLRLAKLTAAFCSLVSVVYVTTASEPSPIVALMLSFGPLLAVILWLQKDARRTGVGSVHDWGYFLLLAWPVVIPWYALKTRGRSGWRLTAGLFVLILSAYISAVAAVYFVWFFHLSGY